MKGKGLKNGWVLLILMLAGMVVGGFLGEMASKVEVLSFLNYGQHFGINSSSPVVLDLSVIVLTLGLELRLNIASIIGIAVAFVVYRKWM